MRLLPPRHAAWGGQLPCWGLGSRSRTELGGESDGGGGDVGGDGSGDGGGDGSGDTCGGECGNECGGEAAEYSLAQAALLCLAPFPAAALAPHRRGRPHASLEAALLPLLRCAPMHTPPLLALLLLGLAELHAASLAHGTAADANRAPRLLLRAVAASPPLRAALQRCWDTALQPRLLAAPQLRRPMQQLLGPLSAGPSLARLPTGSAANQHGEHGEQVQLGASNYLLPRGLTASTGKRPKPVSADDDDDDDEHLDLEVGGERRRRRGPTTLVFQREA